MKSPMEIARGLRASARKRLVLRSAITAIVLISFSVAAFAVASTQFGKNEEFEKYLIAGLASAVLSAGTVGLLDRIFLSADLLENVDDILKGHIEAGPLAAYGLTHVGNRDSYHFYDIYTGAKERIWMMGIGLPLLSDERAQNQLKTCMEQDEPPEVRILLLNPWSAASVRRGHDSAYPEYDEYLNDLISDVRRYFAIGRRLEKELGVTRDQYDVRLYSTNPYVSLFVMDGAANFSFYLDGVRGASATYFECSNGGRSTDLFRPLKAHFQSVWSQSISIFEDEFIAKLKKDIDRTASEVGHIDVDRTVPDRMTSHGGEDERGEEL